MFFTSRDKDNNLVLTMDYDLLDHETTKSVIKAVLGTECMPDEDDYDHLACYNLGQMSEADEARIERALDRLQGEISRKADIFKKERLVRQRERALFYFNSNFRKGYWPSDEDLSAFRDDLAGE